MPEPFAATANHRKLFVAYLTAETVTGKAPTVLPTNVRDLAVYRVAWMVGCLEQPTLTSVFMEGGRTMPPIVSSIEIDRPPDEVFSYVTDPSRFAEWQYDVLSVRLEGSSPPRVGSRFTTIRRIGRAERTMTQEITEINPPTSWAARGVAGPIRPSASISVGSESTLFVTSPTVFDTCPKKSTG